MRTGSLIKIFVLLSLLEGPKHGYGLMKDLENRLGVKPNPGQVYPFLREMKDKKLLKTEKNKRVCVFSFTEKGRKFAEDQIEKFGRILEAALKPKLKTCFHCGCKVYDGGYVADKKVFCCKFCAEACRKI
ncbi:MAG: PadR family transcriptional regulator [Candidatus Micrarchaeota archaeon]|nr:PadR family transcriptional regulator [Candidatus Micrarchaeota archaeon]